MVIIITNTKFCTVQKLKKFGDFLNTTFELFVGIGKQTKTCPSGQVLKFWLRGMDFARTAHYVPAARKFVVIRTSFQYIETRSHIQILNRQL